MISHNVCGLSRSGNHAIIFWMIHNYVESIKSIDNNNNIYIDDNRKLCYINNCNIYEGLMKHNFPYDLFPTVIKSYEDIEMNNDTSIIILRDFINLLCSRYKKYAPSIGLNNKYICDLIRLIEVWKQHSHSPRRTILYNKWLVTKEYRNNVSKNIIGIENTVDNTDYVSEIGGGSSFIQNNEKQLQNNYITRYKQIKLPKYMIDYIIKDKELLDINKKIFAIDIEKILC